MGSDQGTEEERPERPALTLGTNLGSSRRGRAGWTTLPRGGRRWPRRLAIGAVGGTALFAVVGFFVAPPIIRHVAQKQLGELLGRKVTIDRIRLNPFALSVAVEGLRVFEKDGVASFFGWRRLYVNAQLSSVFRRAPIVQELSLDGLRIHVARLKATDEAWADVAGAYNFSDVVARLTAPPKNPEPPKPPSPSDGALPRFSLNNLRLSDAAFTFDDVPLGAHHEITQLSIGVPFVSTLPVYVDSFVQPGLSVRVDGTPFSVDGRTKPFKDSLETVLEVRLRALDLTKYLAFVPVKLPFVIDSAKLTLALDVAFVRQSADAPRLTVKGQMALTEVGAREKRRSGLTPLLSLERLAIDVGEADVTNQTFAIDKVAISGLEVHARRGPDGTLNLQRLGPPEEKGRAHATVTRAPSPPPPAPNRADAAPTGPRFKLGVFSLDKTTIHFADEGVTPRFETEVRDVRVSVRGLSNAAEATAKVEASLRALPGGEVKQSGTLRLTPFAAAGKIEVDGIEPGRFAAYYHDAIAFDIARGRLRLGAGYDVADEHAQTAVRLRDAFVELSDLALNRRGARDPFFKMGAFAVHGAAVDLGKHRVHVAEIVTQDAKVRVARDAKGVVDLTTLVPAPAPAPAAPRPSKPPPPAPAASAPAWTVDIDSVGLEKWGARFEDRAVTPAAIVNVDPVNVHLINVSTARGAKMGVDVRLAVNKTGRLQIAGTAALDPFAANLKVDLKTLEIIPLQSYFRDQVSLTVTSGTVSVKAQAAIKTVSGGDPQVNLTADLDVADLATVDRAKQERLLAWKAFHVGGLKVTTPPLAIAVGQVALTDFDSRLVLFPDAHFNLQEAFAAPGAASAPAAKAAAPTAKKPPASRTAKPAAQAKAQAATPPGPAITIGQLTLQGGTVTFSDRSMRPNYTAELTELGGRVSGLSSTPGTTADVDLRGSVNRSGTLAILGKVNPLAKDLFLDMKVDVQDFELPPTSPYSGKYVGYGIGKGKLDLTLAYKIAGGKLDASNKVVIDQLTFGDKVDSPDAVKLPVRLAVALLKDRHGVIDIDLPIAGSLEDPQFKIWRAVFKVLFNLVAKAATAPFSLIASAFGGGEELSKIDFPPGLAAIDATGNKRMAALAKALRERPGLSFEIAGEADPGQDRDGLRRFLYERKLKKAKMDDLVQAGATVASVDDLTIEPAEREGLLHKAYDAAKFPKPTNAIGFEKRLPPVEQEKLLLANTRVEEDQLRELALRRATAVQALLSKSLPEAAHRLFLVTPRASGGHRRVELKLKE